eukprot:gene8818-biopygen7652
MWCCSSLGVEWVGPTSPVPRGARSRPWRGPRQHPPGPTGALSRPWRGPRQHPLGPEELCHGHGGAPGNIPWAHRSSVTAMAGPPATSPGPTGALSRPWRGPWQHPLGPPELCHGHGGVHHSTSERSERGECFTRTPPTSPRPEARPVARPVAHPAARPVARPEARPGRVPRRVPWRVTRRVPRRVPWGGRDHHSTSERNERGECFTHTPPTPPHPEARPDARPGRVPRRVPWRVPRRVPGGGPVHHSTSERSERGECFARTPPTPPHPE